MTKITDEIRELFDTVRALCGAGVRSVELTDDELCKLLNVAIADYSERVQNEIIANQWISFYGKRLGNSNDLAFGFMAKSLDLSKQYSYWFSKQVGLQQAGPWELKKDFFKIEPGKQVYVIPSGRTVNKVFYVNPPMTDTALFGHYGGGMGMIPGLGAAPAYGYGGGMGGFFTTQVSDVAFLAADLTFKSRLFRGDMAYKMTAGPDGTHLVHLMSTPGSKVSFGFSGRQGNLMGLVGCEVWYTYYDTTSPEDEDECKRFHADDVILSADQIPMEQMDYHFLNTPAQTVVRQLLVAKAKETLGIIRGKYSGKVSIPQAEMSMDYQMLIQQGKEEYNATMDNLMKRLERMRPVNIMKETSELLEHNQKILGYTPLGIYVG